jgi:hypothetical protein
MRFDGVHSFGLFVKTGFYTAGEMIWSVFDFPVQYIEPYEE